MTGERWRYAPEWGGMVRYAVALRRGVLTATSPYDTRKAVARDENEAEDWFLLWGMCESRVDAAAAAVNALTAANALAAERLDAARSALRRETADAGRAEEARRGSAETW